MVLERLAVPREMVEQDDDAMRHGREAGLVKYSACLPAPRHNLLFTCSMYVLCGADCSCEGV